MTPLGRSPWPSNSSGRQPPTTPPRRSTPGAQASPAWSSWSRRKALARTRCRHRRRPYGARASPHTSPRSSQATLPRRCSPRRGSSPPRAASAMSRRPGRGRGPALSRHELRPRYLPARRASLRRSRGLHHRGVSRADAGRPACAGRQHLARPRDLPRRSRPRTRDTGPRPITPSRNCATRAMATASASPRGARSSARPASTSSPRSTWTRISHSGLG